MVIQICVGSSCHLKGSEQLVGLFQQAIEKNALSDEITLAGCFCTGNCNRVGVTIVIDDVAHPGITPETFQQFFDEYVLKELKKTGA